MKKQMKVNREISYAIGIDVGGTKTRAGIVSGTGELISGLKTILTPSREIYPGLETKELQGLLIEELHSIVKKIRADYPGCCINRGAVSFAGLVENNSIITKAADRIFKIQSDPLF